MTRAMRPFGPKCSFSVRWGPVFSRSLSLRWRKFLASITWLTLQNRSLLDARCHTAVWKEKAVSHFFQDIHVAHTLRIRPLEREFNKDDAVKGLCRHVGAD